MKLSLFIILVCCCRATSAFAEELNHTQTIQIYQWTDNSEIIHYSQFPPQDKNNNFNVAKTQVSIPTSVPSKEANTKDWRVNIKQYIDERASARKTRAMQKKMAKTNKDNCTTARKSLELYQSGRRIRTRTNDNSEIQTLSERDRLNQIKQSEKNIKSYC